MNRLVKFTTENVNALVGALELNDVAFCNGDAPRRDDGALEGAMQMGPNGPTSILANCYATKSALCPRIDDGEPPAQA